MFEKINQDRSVFYLKVFKLSFFRNKIVTINFPDCYVILCFEKCRLIKDIKSI